MFQHRCKAGDHKVHEPPEIDANDAANAVEEDFLAEQAFHHSTLFLHNDPMCGVQDTLTIT